MPLNSFSNVRWLLSAILLLSLIMLVRTSFAASGDHPDEDDDDDDDDHPFSGSEAKYQGRATIKYYETTTVKYAYRTTTTSTASLEASTFKVQNPEQQEERVHSADRFSVPTTTIAIGVSACFIAFIITVVVGVLVVVVVVKRKQRLSRPQTRNRESQIVNFCEVESCSSHE